MAGESEKGHESNQIPFSVCVLADLFPCRFCVASKDPVCDLEASLYTDP